MNVLSNDQIRAVAPSVFAMSKHESRSERYAYIPTVTIIDALRVEGFMPVAAIQGKSRIPGKSDFTKHMVRFRREESMVARAVGDAIPEVVLRNSHDGTGSYVLNAGCFRLVCLNGMVVPAGESTEFRIGHTGNIIDRVIEGSYRVIDSATAVADRAMSWKAIELQEPEVLAFGAAAGRLRFAEEQVTPRQIVSVRRAADQSNDLWTVFNRAQEAIIRGGQTYISHPQNGERARRLATRPVKEIDRNVGLNQALWTLGEEMARIKQAA